MDDFHFVWENLVGRTIEILNEVIPLSGFVKILLMHRDRLGVRQVVLHDPVALRRLLLVSAYSTGLTLGDVVVACCVVANGWMGC
jgi:hypothetical protein